MRPRVRKICGMPSISSAGRIFAPVKDQAKTNSETAIRSHDRALRFGGGAAVKISPSPSLTVKFFILLAAPVQSLFSDITLGRDFASLTHARVHRQVAQVDTPVWFRIVLRVKDAPNARAQVFQLAPIRSSTALTKRLVISNIGLALHRLEPCSHQISSPIFRACRCFNRWIARR